MGNKMLGRQMLSNAEEAQATPEEHTGSRKGFKAPLTVLNKRLYFDILRQLKQSGAILSNDAKSCYDRIVHAPASMGMQRWGVPPEAAVCMLSTIQNLEHKVKTAFGLSDLTYGGTKWQLPCHGIGQGNGAGPAIWLCVSSPIIASVRGEKRGIKLQKAITKEKLYYIGFSFVDDTDLFINTTGLDTPSWTQVCEELQSLVTQWEGGIWATGGSIVPEKSFWSLIDFTWKQGKWKYKKIKDTPWDIYVLDNHRQWTLLPRTEPNIGSKTLGVILAPDGNNKQAWESLLDMASKWNEQVKTNHLQQPEAWFGLVHSVMKSMEYPLLALTLTEQECDKLSSKLLDTALAATGVCRTIPKAVREGPLRYNGLGLGNFYVKSGTAWLSTVQEYASSSSATGKFLRNTWELLNLEVGTFHNVFSLPYTTWGHLAASTWLTALWKFLSIQDILLLPTVIPLQPSCEQDQSLMDLIVPGTSPDKSQAFN